MNELSIIKVNGGAYIDSREVAEIIGKDHRNLLRDIRGYAEILKKRGALNFELSSFFIESAYVSAQNKSMPCYLLSKMGCEMVATKLTGEKGVLFSFAYVKRFNELEAAEREREIKMYNKPRLSEFNSAVRNVLDGMSYSQTEPKRVMNFLRGVYEPLGIGVREDGGERGFFNVTVIARTLGIYSDTGKPHGHAVSAIIEKLGIHEHHSIVVPYGLVGFSFRYDVEVAKAVQEWLAYSNYPHVIPHLDFNYHIYYDRQLSLFDNDEDDTNADLDFYEYIFTDGE